MDLKATHRRRCKRILAAMLAVSAWHIAATPHAAELPWAEDFRFQYVAKDQDLRDLLQEFADSRGFALHLSEGVQGNVDGQFDMAPRALLEFLAARYGFLWYYDGAQLHITPSSYLRTEVILLPVGMADQLHMTLAGLGILDGRYPLQIEGEGLRVVISGPSRYVDLVLQIADSMRQPENSATGMTLEPDTTNAPQITSRTTPNQELIPSPDKSDTASAQTAIAPVVTATATRVEPETVQIDKPGETDSTVIAQPAIDNTPSPAPVLEQTTTASTQPAAVETATETAVSTSTSVTGKSVEAHVAPVALPEEKPLHHWEISFADNTLKSAMTRWATEAGWHLLWELPVDYQIEASTSIPGSFEDAVEVVARSMQQSDSPMKAIFYKGNKVLRIVRRERE